jgi:hypothetical protein
MKEKNPNLALWQSCQSCGVSSMLKSSTSCFFVVGLVCCFVAYCGVVLVSWFQ